MRGATLKKACNSNYFKGITRQNIYDGDKGISGTGDYIRISQDVDSKFNYDANVFKTWLSEMYKAGKPLIVNYATKTPKEEIITLQELPTYEDYTKIEVVTEVAPSKIEAEYDGYTITE